MPETLYKTCTKCNKELPVATEFFHKHVSGKFEVSFYCKACIKAYRDSHKEETI